MKHDPLLDPFNLRHLTLRNRIMSTAHAPAYEEGGHPRDAIGSIMKKKPRAGSG